MERFIAAVDLGTTTVELSLLRQDGSVVAKSGFMNPQSRFGSDVISRMTWLDRNPESDEMRVILEQSLQQNLSKMLSWQKAEFPQGLERIIVTCNTVMGTILKGASTAGLGQAPFGMPFTENATTSLFGVPMEIMVGASAFLGSDASGGAWALGLGENEMLMDLGTNGEMILLHGGILTGASAACGPAFENCTRAQGIYGSTTLSVLSNLLRRGTIKGDGTLPSEIAENGIESNGIRITPKILHSVQLAVGALYATFSMLLKRAGIGSGELERIYVSGGFGFHLSLRDMVTVGLLPEQVIQKVKVSGNTSLLAAEKLAAEGESGEKDYREFRKRIVTHQFAGDPEYEGAFYSSMILQQR